MTTLLRRCRSKTAERKPGIEITSEWVTRRLSHTADRRSEVDTETTCRRTTCDGSADQILFKK